MASNPDPERHRRRLVARLRRAWKLAKLDALTSIMIRELAEIAFAIGERQAAIERAAKPSSLAGDADGGGLVAGDEGPLPGQAQAGEEAC